MDGGHTWLVPDFGGKLQSFIIKYDETWGRYNKFAYWAVPQIPFQPVLEKEEKGTAPYIQKLARHSTLLFSFWT